MFKNLQRILILFCLISLLCIEKSIAGIETYETSKKGIKKGDSLLVNDEKFKSPLFNWADITNVSVLNAISIKINDENPISSSFSCQATLRIEYYSSPTQTLPTEITSVNLNVDYSKEAGASYKIADTYRFNNGYHVKVFVTEFNSPQFGENIPPIIELTNTITIDRKYLFKPQAGMGLGANFRSAANGSTGGGVGKQQLDLTWSPVAGAEEYDIEWVSIDEGSEFEGILNGMLYGSTPVTANDEIRLFRNNATRITTEANSYVLSLIYNSKYLAVRIRQASYNSLGIRVTGNWDYHLGTGYAAWELDWHEENLNWQYSASFAEEGKRKEVINYFDGSLRGRQTVTINNSDNIAVLQENVYDEFGRPVASILPAPVKESGEPYLHYFSAFNRKSFNVPYSFRDIVNGCELKPDTLSSEFGASKYYSKLNPFLNDINYAKKYNSYIPDAERYPLSLTQYTGDNTGRIKVQGGVGKMFQPGDGGSKTTKYYYGKPEQWELDRLFGNDIGYAEHYLKNMVVDPNGQISISYLNASGKTVATALSGQGSEAMDTVTSSSITSQKKQVLLKPESFIFDATALKIKASTTFLASVPDSNTVIYYDIQKLIYNHYNTPTFKLCSNCYYELNISIKDDCDKDVYQTTQSVKIGSPKEDCNNEGVYTDSLEHVKFSKIGEYYINFELAFNRDTIEAFTESAIKQGLEKGFIKDELYYVLKRLDEIDFKSCFSDCKNAKTLLGTEQSFASLVSLKLQQLGVTLANTSNPQYASWITSKYAYLLNYVNQLTCSPPSPCESFRTLMLQDVTRYGQYALFDTLGNTLEPSINVIAQNWRIGTTGGEFPVKSKTDPDYIKEQITLNNGIVISPYDADFQLTDLIKYWKDEWAEKFLKYHPEYCRLDYCEKNTDYYVWYNNVKEIETANEIYKIQGGLSYNYSNAAWLLDADPFFQQKGAAYLDSMRQDLLQYSLRVLNINSSSVATKNVLQYVDYSVYCIDGAANQGTAWNNCIPISSCRLMDREWETYKDLYFELREKYNEKVRGDNCTSSCKIGQPINFPVPEACPVAGDFVLEGYHLVAGEWEPLPSCTSQTIKLRYQGVQINGNVKVDIEIAGQQTASFVFTSPYNEFFFCLPEGVALKDVVIKPTCVADCSSYDYSLLTTYKWQGTSTLKNIYTNNVLSSTTRSYANNSLNFSTNQAFSGTLDVSHGSWQKDNNTCELIFDQGTAKEVRSVILVLNSNQLVLSTRIGDIEYIQNFTPKKILENPEAGIDYYVEDFYTDNSNPQNIIVNYISDHYPDYYEVISVSQNNDFCNGLSYNSFYGCNIPGSWVNGSTSFRSSLKLKTGTGSVIQYTDRYVNVARRDYMVVDRSSLSESAFHIIQDSRFSWFDQEAYQTQSSTGKVTRLLIKENPGVVRCNPDDEYYTVDVDLREDRYSYFPELWSDFYDYIPGYLKKYLITVDLQYYDGYDYLDEYAEHFRTYSYGYLNCSTQDAYTYPYIPRFKVTSPPAVSAACLAYQNKESRFLDNPILNQPINPNAIDASNKAAIAKQVNTACYAKADYWMKKLSPGFAGHPDSVTIDDDLRSFLAEVCVAGGDLNHPTGASTIGPAGGGSWTSFGEVIQYVMQNWMGLNHFTKQLNPWLLDDTYPYSPVPQFTNTMIRSVSPEICSKITALQQERNSVAPNSTFYSFLLTKYGAVMNITEQELAMLEQACGSCYKLLPRDIQLPIFLDPASPGCISGSDYLSAKQYLLNVEFPPGELTEQDSVYGEILTTYINFKYGLTLSEHDYRAFETIASNPSAVLCNKPTFASFDPDPFDCIKMMVTLGVQDGQKEYVDAIFAEKEKFRLEYVTACAAAKSNTSLKTKQKTFHYTLYYYDQADNLVRTIPPEGVYPLSDSQAQLANAVRMAGNTVACTADPNFPTGNSVKATALTGLESALATSTGSSVEMWLYSQNIQSMQMLATTPGNTGSKFMFQTCISGNTLNVDVFTLSQPADPKSIVFTNSNHVSVNIAGLVPLNPWTHVVIQASNFQTGTLNVFVNGQAVPAIAGGQQNGCGWEVISGGDPIQMPENLSSLKYLRVYDQQLSPLYIVGNAQESCFMLASEHKQPLNAALTGWYRFNTPDAGGETLAGGVNTSKIETQSNTPVYPQHSLATSYAYNTTNQVVKQATPDGGSSKFWYDDLSRLVVSQNARQAQNSDYSYTKYDVLGRLTEVGQKNYVNSGLSEPDYLSSTAYQNFLSGGSNSQITETVYDTAPLSGNGIPGGLIQDNLHKRVSASIYRENPSSTSINASYYSYDIAGNVKTLYQQVSGLGLKKIDYEYDLVSGKVNLVAYQHGQNDQFYYQYKYDAENRLTEAWSSTQAIINPYAMGSTLPVPERKLDAYYQYYLHGPLARVELGDEGTKVQGTDYAYTLQGWLKGVNGNALNPATEINNDGAVIGKDVMAYSLGYYQDDYKPVGGSTSAAFGMQYIADAVTGKSLYNGNISNSTVAIQGINGGNVAGYSYRYDQLNRLKEFRQHALSNSTTSWNSGSISSAYSESFNYDGNGNILSASRTGNSGAMDNLNYGYNRDATGKLINNRLRHVKDAVGAGAYNEDIDNQNDDNYSYDAIGNLTADSHEGITSIDWTVYGKIKSIAKNSGTISYQYDPSGNRVSKTANNLTTWYVRDAQGNSLAVYDNANSATNWKEQQLYGSSRLGIWKPEINIGSTSGTAIWSLSGKKAYELSNHLGNVLAVISDSRILNGSTYDATVLSAQDYYAFGMLQPGRTWHLGDSYRYGFNGKENDNEVKGEGNQQDYGFRIYDPRLGRFLSVDPLSPSYPWYTPYQFAGNKPVNSIDLDGLEPVEVSFYLSSQRPLPKIGKTEWYVVRGKAIESSYSAAFRYNIVNSNPGAYQNIEARHNWYAWAAKNAKDNYWFAAATDVTSKTMVGGADMPNTVFMNDQEENVLRGANEFLLKENFKNFGKYALGDGPVTWNGKSYANLSGAELDKQMVVIEMTTLQGYLNDYKNNYIKNNGQDAWNDLHQGLNALFDNRLLSPLTPAANRYAQKEFSKKFGKDAKFDFMNLDHRIFQGQKMAEYLRTHDKKDKKGSN